MRVPPVPELSVRGVIQKVFPLHEQRILSQLMKSWVQAVCEKQPLGQYQWRMLRGERLIKKAGMELIEWH